MMQYDTYRIRLRLHGRVQGVGFRWFVVTQAERLGIRGWVRNAGDGSVEVHAEGTASAIAAFRTKLAQGPPAARVTNVEVLPPSDAVLPAGFEIVR